MDEKFKLEPCPFCGGKVIVEFQQHTHIKNILSAEIECENKCYRSNPKCNSNIPDAKESLINLINKRYKKEKN